MTNYMIVGYIPAPKTDSLLPTPPIRTFYVALNLDTLRPEKLSAVDCDNISKYSVINFHFGSTVGMDRSINSANSLPRYDENFKYLDSKPSFVVVAKRFQTYYLSTNDFKIETVDASKLKKLLQLDSSYVRNAYLDKYQNIGINQNRYYAVQLTEQEHETQLHMASDILRNVIDILLRQVRTYAYAAVGTISESGPVQTVQWRVPGYKLIFSDSELQIEYNNLSYIKEVGALDVNIRGIKNDVCVVKDLNIVNQLRKSLNELCGAYSEYVLCVASGDNSIKRNHINYEWSVPSCIKIFGDVQATVKQGRNQYWTGD